MSHGNIERGRVVVYTLPTPFSGVLRTRKFSDFFREYFGEPFSVRTLDGWSWSTLDRKFHMKDDIRTANNLIQDHGGATIFWARYIFGLRTIAGPVAGSLRMEWRKFLLFNALGAVSWIVAIAITGYFFADTFQSLAGFIEKISWGVSATVLATGYLVWRKKKKELRQSAQQ